MTTYRIALIGTGSFAAHHVSSIREMRDRTTIIAAVDIDAERVKTFCADHAIPQSYTDAAAMLAAERPDLVVIVTPPYTHCDLSIQALEAGAYVLCEKPLCASLAEFDAITDAEVRTGRSVSTIFQWRFGSGAQHTKHLIESGALGHPLVGMCQTLWFRGQAYYDVPWRGKWATEIGGTTMGHGIHLMDLFLWLMGGDWYEVRAIMGTLDRDIEVDTASMALVSFASGAMGSITNSILSPRQESVMRLDFQRATVDLSAVYYADNAHWSYHIPENSPDTEALATWRQITSNRTGNHAAQLSDLLDSLDRGERPLLTGDEARRIIEFTTCLYKSARTGQPITRGSIMPDDPYYHAISGITHD